MTKQELKKLVLDCIDENASAITGLGQKLYDRPELGYKETYAAGEVASFLKELGYDVEEQCAVTGLIAKTAEKNDGPTIAVMGELDAIACPDHADADSATGAVHACGHNMQIAAMAGVALALKKTGALEKLGGNVSFMAVPAEEFVEMEFRSELKKDGRISYFGGKQEFIAQGLLDEVDMSMMIHSLNLGTNEKGEPNKTLIAPNGNGFIGKKIQFIGKESHAGGAPEEGINALNAAMIALNSIHAQRETFKDSDRIRVHPIITKGGDIVNVVPADVRMECYVRGRTIEGMKDANEKVNRALKAAAMAVGAEVVIDDMPGYMPLLNEPRMDALLRGNVTELHGAEATVEGGDFTGSFDFGDVSHIMPALHPFTGGVTGSLHTREFAITDQDTAYLHPTRAMALTLIDLLWDDAAEAKSIITDFTPTMTKDEYLGFLRELEKVQRFKG